MLEQTIAKLYRTIMFGKGFRRLHVAVMTVAALGLGYANYLKYVKIPQIEPLYYEAFRKADTNSNGKKSVDEAFAVYDFLGLGGRERIERLDDEHKKKYENLKVITIDEARQIYLEVYGNKDVELVLRHPLIFEFLRESELKRYLEARN